MTTQRTTLICQQNEEGKFGFVNEQGKEVIPFIYLKASDFHDGYALVMDNETHRKFIDESGKIVFELECECASAPIFGRFDTPEKWNAFVELVNKKEEIEKRWWRKLIETVYIREINEKNPDWDVMCDKNWTNIRWLIKDEKVGSLLIYFCQDYLSVTYDCNFLNEKEVNKLLFDKHKFEIIKTCFDRIDVSNDETIELQEYHNFTFGSTYDGKIPIDTLLWYAGNRTDEFADQLIKKVRKFQKDEITVLFKEINERCRIKKRSK